MSTEQKLNYFAQTMMEEAESSKRRVARTAQAQAESAITSALEEARTHENERIRARSHAAKIIRYKQIAAAIAHERERLWERKQALVVALFAEVEGALGSFVTSEAYRAYLEEGIHTATRLGGFSVVQLMRRDSDTVLPDGITMEISERDFLGGFILLNEARTMHADYTLQTRLSGAMAAYAER